ncbi:sensor histidine kinase [Halobacillus salinarum]|uniref:histidine kinase n=1 Tax=Halobacillus salinarum TaxID=2932257 RepID=A0ABY4EI09_9BACI|nr:sensor histidine kinase [Halobacillus salinarum]UOQ44055.1 sensor histidine kinase [Halobacillus salinarum]
MRFNKIRVKIFLAMLLSTCIPLIITSGIISYQISDSIKKDNQLANLSVERDLKGHISDYYQSLNETAYSIYYNNELLQSLRNGKDYQPNNSYYYDAQKDIQQFFLNVYNSSRVKGILGITLLDKNMHYINSFTPRGLYGLNNQYLENVKKSIKDKDFSEPIIHIKYENIYKRPMLQYIFPVSYMGNRIGALVIDIEESYFRNMVENYNVFYNGEISLTRAHTIIYHTDRSLVGKKMSNDLRSKDMNYINSSITPGLNLRYQYQTDPKHIFFRKIVIIIVVLAFLVTVTISFLLSFTITNPIIKLHKKMANLQKGDFETRVEVHSKDEIGDLEMQFNNMASRIQQLIEHDFKLQLTNKETQIRALQAQISPHFLYNTLQTMSNIATMNNSPEIKIMCQSLGNMYRYNMNLQDEFINVRKEVMHIRNYLVIINKRFPELIRVHIKMKPQLNNLLIPKLILQPLVENAIEHGLIPSRRKKKLLKIYLEIDEKNKWLKINILDNGVGISEEKLNEIQNNLQLDGNKEGNSIGLYNVHTRVNLLCGKEYGLSIKSKYGAGTLVTIKLPLQRGSEHENSNR